MKSSFFVRVNNIFNFINFLICIEFNLTKFNVNKKEFISLSFLSYKIFLNYFFYYIYFFDFIFNEL